MIQRVGVLLQMRAWGGVCDASLCSRCICIACAIARRSKRINGCPGGEYSPIEYVQAVDRHGLKRRCGRRVSERGERDQSSASGWLGEYLSDGPSYIREYKYFSLLQEVQIQANILLHRRDTRLPTKHRQQCKASIQQAHRVCDE